MKNVLRKVVFAILLIPIFVILAAFFLPSSFRVERSLVIQAGPDRIFPYLNTLRRWPEWTAWTTNREPSLVYSYAGPADGVGAIQSWVAQSGNGTIKLTASSPTDGIGYEFNFNEGRLITRGRIQMLAVDEGTRLVWTNEGELGRNPVGRYLGLLMDKWMGADLETGLQNLKLKLESQKK